MSKRFLKTLSDEAPGLVGAARYALTNVSAWLRKTPDRDLKSPEEAKLSGGIVKYRDKELSIAKALPFLAAALVPFLQSRAVTAMPSLLYTFFLNVLLYK